MKSLFRYDMYARITVACCLARLASPMQLSTSSQALERFTFVVLPDTQGYSTSAENAVIGLNQTRWIVDQIKRGNKLNIRFVSHVGDFIDRYESRAEQWPRAKEMMAPLMPTGTGADAAVVPLAVLPGNHDFTKAAEGAPKKSEGAPRYLHNFGPQHFQALPWFGGAAPGGLSSFQYFSSGGVNFLHLALEWQPSQNIPRHSDAPLEWASQVIRDHPGMPVVLSTHEYLEDTIGQRLPEGNRIFDQLVSNHDQIFLVLCGHYHDLDGSDKPRGEWYQVSKNSYGRPVVEVYSNYQDYPNGGEGWLRMITFEPTDAGGELRFQTYSPWLNAYKEGSVEQKRQRPVALPSARGPWRRGHVW
eukprot:TRINITY_DN14796_c0_g1_i1.p1 TRINITY_DN14796_c0_g1~~TRINITY_DN14796_c0_g1_i1.p1  ORF type:complete len:359 (+),score=50.98 TRINITY_DN14796_c0_g1_i1:146-1222(+)